MYRSLVERLPKVAEKSFQILVTVRRALADRNNRYLLHKIGLDDCIEDTPTIDAQTSCVNACHLKVERLASRWSGIARQ